MNKTFIRILAPFIALTFVFSFVACNSKKDTETTTATEAVESATVGNTAVASTAETAKTAETVPAETTVSTETSFKNTTSKTTHGIFSTTKLLTVLKPTTAVPSTTQAETSGKKTILGIALKLLTNGYEETTTEPITLPPLPSSAKIDNVPYLNQISLGYPMGCEAVSGTMLLNFYGYDVTAHQMVDAVPAGSKKYQKDGVWYAADPFEEFVGDPRKKRADGAYGCFAKPLAEGMSIFAGDRVKNISGCTVEDLFRHVSNGKPVVVWGASTDVVIYEGVEWQCVDSNGNLTGKTYQELVREHCMVLIGYTQDSVILHDPSKGANKTQPMSQFTANWTKLFSQAIIIE